ncbi:MAG: hypothetical protein WAP03_27605 [Methylorubrum rhodinum]|uniref:hypothetical protein n=1 Tax=Methylorubrum rhodinum TaxID=29428 RepID=UPI003BB18237
MVPKPDNAWNIGTPTEVTAEVATPRVGYLDFLRWMTNVDLRKALGASGDRFMSGLSMAYAMRHVDPSLATALDRLPDPAVDKVRLTLATTDTLGGGTGFAPDECEIDLSDRLSKVADKFGAKWALLAPAEEWPDFKREDLLDLLLHPLDKAFRFSVTMIGGPGTPRPLKYDPAKSLATAYVPEGVVADLAAEALVKRTHFGPATDRSKPPGIIHEGLLQHASRERRGGYVSFPSFALRIETMIDAVPDMHDETRHAAFIALAERMIEVAPAASARRYDLVTRNPPETEDYAAWRLYSHADVLSQRWLPSGRPAYRTFEPKRHAWEGKAGTAAFRLAWRVPEAGIAGSEQAREAIAEYEREVFFDRPNIDADPLTQRLLPLPAVTLLQSFPWDWPSATYLRHRFTLRSRYAGALRKPERRQISAFPPVQRDRKRREIAETWTLRAVILADFARVQVTRPQLRALIPLTSAPGQAGTPPVLAILQEPPFSHGGLADRVTAELKTGFGYGFELGGPTVEIRDSRKEIGPDPRLDYRPTPAEDVLWLGLAAEGPIGLTFDPVQAGRPTFSNSAYLLTPRRPDGESPNYEEHCLGVSMSRHLNPAWTFFPPQARPDVAPSKTTASAKTNGLVADRAWWVTFPARASRSSRPKKGSPVELLGAGGITALSAARSGDSVSLLTTNLGVDGVAGGLEKPIEVARLPQGSEISILHQPVAPGRFLLSVFAGPREAASVSIEAGMSATPLMMASFEWGVPKGAGATDVPLRVPGGAEAEPVLASAPTFLAWTRTLRAFDRGTVAHPERAPDAARVDISELRARIEEREPPGKDPVQIVTLLKGAQPLFLTSSTEADPFPVHVHRHLAFVLTRLLEGPGRPVEEYVGAGRFCGDQAPMPAGKASTTDRLNLRLIEMETSAAALCGTDSDAIPSAYRTRYVDLASTGWVEGSAATLFLRPVGSKAHLGKLESLTLSMNAVGGSTAAPRFEISIAPGDAIRMIEIDFVDTKWAARVIRLSGTCEPAVIKEMEKHQLPKLSGKGFFLTVDAAPKGAPGEFWCDISLLHGKRE